MRELVGEQKFTGPMRNMLPVDRHVPIRCAMAEWAFKPKDTGNVLKCCREYFEEKEWPNMPIEIEPSKVDHYALSPFNWTQEEAPQGFVMKFNFMYLTGDDQKAFLGQEGKERIESHLKGLWDKLIHEKIKFKPHWGKINFLTPDMVEEIYDWKAFASQVQPMFLNNYLRNRFPERE